METPTLAEATQAINKTKNHLSVSPDNIAGLVDRHCEMVSATRVKTAAAHKDLHIYKVYSAQVLLPSSGDTYINMVKESARELGSDEASIKEYTTSDTFYEHSEVYPVCVSKKDPEKKYLYCIFEQASKPVYVLEGNELSKEEVAEYLTKSERAKLLNDKPKVTENKTHNIVHNVKVRTLSLGNIVSLKALTNS